MHNKSRTSNTSKTSSNTSTSSGTKDTKTVTSNSKPGTRISGGNRTSK